MGEVVDEFRQHDGMLTVVMQLSPQGFAEHYENMTEDEPNKIHNYYHQRTPLLEQNVY
jgi:hypothetical protein